MGALIVLHRCFRVLSHLLRWLRIGDHRAIVEGVGPLTSPRRARYLPADARIDAASFLRVRPVPRGRLLPGVPHAASVRSGRSHGRFGHLICEALDVLLPLAAMSGGVRLHSGRLEHLVLLSIADRSLVLVQVRHPVLGFAERQGQRGIQIGRRVLRRRDRDGRLLVLNFRRLLLLSDVLLVHRRLRLQLAHSILWRGPPPAIGLTARSGL